MKNRITPNEELRGWNKSRLDTVDGRTEELKQRAEEILQNGTGRGKRV